jgi:predicted RND superfamily exporter protein
MDIIRFRDQGVKYWSGVFRLVLLCLFENWRYIIFAIIVLFLKQINNYGVLCLASSETSNMSLTYIMHKLIKWAG